MTLSRPPAASASFWYALLAASSSPCIRADRYAVHSWKRTSAVAGCARAARVVALVSVGVGVGVIADNPGGPGTPRPPDRSAVCVDLGRDEAALGVCGRDPCGAPM